MSRYIKRYGFLIFCFLFSGGFSTALAQFYVSSKVCVSDQSAGSGGETGCANPAYFFDLDPSSVDWQWNFGNSNTDGTPNTVSGIRNPQSNYSSPGTYNVQLNKTNAAGVVTSVTQSITVGALPNQPKFNGKTESDTTVCTNATLTLDPFKLGVGAGNYDYLWFPGGETTRTLDVDTSGCYSVEVFDRVTGCSRKAKINVKFCYQETSGGGGSEKWFFGNGASLLFNADRVSVPRDSLASKGDIFSTPEDSIKAYSPGKGPANPLSTNTASAMVYGPKGELAFYTDGKSVYNGNDQMITNAAGNGLIGNNTSSQALAIVPKNDCVECPHHQYYVFSKDMSTGLLSYSILDLRYNGGQGQIIEQGIPVVFDPTDKMAVVSTNEGASFDIYIHEKDNNKFQKISVDSAGINTEIMPIGTALDEPADETGFMTISPNGELLAQGLVINGQNYVEVYDRDDDGTLTLKNTINLGYRAPPQVYGLSFNEDNQFLYATISGDPANGETSRLLQIPLYLVNDATISGQISTISSSSSEQYGAVQLGPVDVKAEKGKFIYMAVIGSDKIAYIQKPDFQGDAATVGFIDVNNGVEMEGTSGFALPTVVYAAQSQDGEGISASYSGNCFMSTTNLITNEICNPMRNVVTWEFEDGSSLKGKNVNYTFPKTGWNKITVRIKVYKTSPVKKVVNNQILNKVLELTEEECTETTFVDSIYIKPSPVINMPDSAYVCKRDSPITRLVIEPEVTGGDTFDYLWMTSLGVPLSDGSTDSAVSVIVDDLYKLEVTNNFDCVNESEILVLPGCPPQVEFPTAFTPGGANPKFKFPYKYLDDPELKIYNRWGEIIFETKDLDILWDGTLKGKIVPMGVYPYALFYESDDFPQWGRVKKVGAVWVLR